MGFPRIDNHHHTADGSLITKVSEGTEKDVDIAVDVAEKAFHSSWGLKASGSHRSGLLWKLAQLMERDKEELAAIEALDNGMYFESSKTIFLFS